MWVWSDNFRGTRSDNRYGHAHKVSSRGIDPEIDYSDSAEWYFTHCGERLPAHSYRGQYEAAQTGSAHDAEAAHIPLCPVCWSAGSGQAQPGGV